MQRPLQRLAGFLFDEPEDRRSRHADEADRAGRGALEYQARNGAGQDREIGPLVAIEARGRRDQRNDGEDDEGREPARP